MYLTTKLIRTNFIPFSLILVECNWPTRWKRNGLNAPTELSLMSLKESTAPHLSDIVSGDKEDTPTSPSHSPSLCAYIYSHTTHSPGFTLVQSGSLSDLWVYIDLSVKQGLIITQ